MHSYVHRVQTGIACLPRPRPGSPAFTPSIPRPRPGPRPAFTPPPDLQSAQTAKLGFQSVTSLVTCSQTLSP